MTIGITLQNVFLMKGDSAAHAHNNSVPKSNNIFTVKNVRTSSPKVSDKNPP